MPRNWVISCHAAAQIQKLPSLAYVAATELVEVKAGVTFIQFTSEAIGLDANVGWDLYYYLMHNPPDFAAARRINGYREFTGRTLPNYLLWGEQHWVDSNNLLASGVFVAGDTWHQDPMTFLIKQPMDKSTLTLKNFFDDPEVKSGDVVWWLACKSWMRNAQAVAFPSQPAPQPVLPLNLRAPSRQRANAFSQKT